MEEKIIEILINKLVEEKDKEIKQLKQKISDLEFLLKSKENSVQKTYPSTPYPWQAPNPIPDCPDPMHPGIWWKDMKVKDTDIPPNTLTTFQTNNIGLTKNNIRPTEFPGVYIADAKTTVSKENYNDLVKHNS